MEARLNNWRTAFLCFILALVTLALYGPAIYCDFVNYDDPDYVTNNEIVQRGLTRDGVAWAFQKSHGSNWHPVTSISHMIDCQIFGVRAGGHHFTNLFFHVLTTLLLFLVFKRMTGALWRSAFVAALFAFHPLHVESVAWVSERKDGLSAFFWVLTMWAYVRYAEGKSPKSKVQSPQSEKERPTFNIQRSKFKAGEIRHSMFNVECSMFYFLALLFFALGLMSKPMLVTLPFVLLLLDFWPLHRMSKVQGPKSKVERKRPWTLDFRLWTSLFLEKLPFFALALISCVVTFFVQRGEGAVEHWDTLPLDRRLGNALISYVRYLGKIFWPSDLSVFYPYPDAWPSWQIIGAAIILITITTIVLWQARSRPCLAVGWFWFVGTLIPVIGLVQVGIQSLADRYTYLPGIGIFLMIAWGIAEMDARRSRGKTIALGAAAVLVLAGCFLVTAKQLRVWRNSETLFQHALDVDNQNVVAHVMFAQVLEKENKPDDAVTHYRAALKIKPGFPQMYYNIANVLVGQKKLTEATTNYLQALQMRPDYPEAHQNLAVTLDMQGKFNEAAEHYLIALQAMPNDPDLHQNFGGSLIERGKLDEAIEHYQAALQLRPDSPEAHYNWGVALVRQGKRAEAVLHFQEAFRLRPNYTAARQQLEALK